MDPCRGHGGKGDRRSGKAGKEAGSEERVRPRKHPRPKKKGAGGASAGAAAAASADTHSSRRHRSRGGKISARPLPPPLPELGDGSTLSAPGSESRAG
jgi:hypothetical protein